MIYGKIKFCKFFIKFYDLDINVYRGNWTPIEYVLSSKKNVSEEKKLNILKYFFLELNANLELQSFQGLTLLHIAREFSAMTLLFNIS